MIQWWVTLKCTPKALFRNSDNIMTWFLFFRKQKAELQTQNLSSCNMRFHMVTSFVFVFFF